MAKEPGIFTDLVFNAAVDWLSPVEYDGRALMTLPPGDIRLRLTSLLSWELENLASSLAPLKAFFASTAARDKVGRLVQYVCRLVLGVLSLSSGEVPRDQQSPAVRQLWRLLVAISNARRTFRLLEFGPFIAVARGVAQAGADPQWAPSIMANCAGAAFSFLDRSRWLMDLQLLRGDPRKTSRRAMRWLCVLHAAQCVRHLWRAALASGDARQREALREGVREALKQLLCFLQAAHISRLPGLQTHDAFVGAAGVLTTGLDVRDLWRRRLKPS